MVVKYVPPKWISTKPHNFLHGGPQIMQTWCLLKRYLTKKVESIKNKKKIKKEREKKRNINLLEKKLEYLWRDQQNIP